MAWKKNYEKSNNLEIWSKLSLEFSRKESDLNEIYKLILLQKNVMDVLTYRTNNGFDSVETYVYDNNKKRIITGNFFISDKYTKEDNYKNVQHIINSDNIPNIGKLYELLYEGKIYTSHICGSYKLTTIYNPPRMLGVLIGFERLISWKYRQEEFRNNDYIEFLRRINKLLLENKSQLTNKLSRNKIKFEKNIDFISKPQVPFSAYINKVINDYPITLSMISGIYITNEPSKLKNEISERINALRNDMAHGKLDVLFNEDNTKDLKFMELLFYVLILKELDLSDEDINNKISCLFNIKKFRI